MLSYLYTNFLPYCLLGKSRRRRWHTDTFLVICKSRTTRMDDNFISCLRELDGRFTPVGLSRYFLNTWKFGVCERRKLLSVPRLETLCLYALNTQGALGIIMVLIQLPDISIGLFVSTRGFKLTA